MAAVAGDFVVVVKAGICARNLNCTNLGIPVHRRHQAWQLDLCLAQKIATLLAYGAVIFLAGFAGKQAV